MKNKMSVLIAGLLLALVVVGVIGATNVYAQAQPGTPLHGRGPDGGRGFLGGPELEAAAKALGMTTDELTTAVQGGKTIEQIAQEKGVDFQAVQDAIQAAHATELRDRIQQALADRTITQEHANWLLEGLDKGFIGGRGGFGFGFGGPHGPGFGPGPNQTPVAPVAPSAQPTQSSSG